MRRRLKLLALVLAVAGSAIAFGGPSADAESGGVQVTGQGWWTKLQNASLPTPAPPPPNVKPGQLNVQGAPDGTGTAIAAFKATLGAHDTNPTLTLKVATDTGGDAAILLACRTGSAWTPEENGDFAHAPHVDDKTCVNAQRSSDGKTYVVPLGALQFGTQLDVVLTPGKNPALPAPAGAPFQLVFEKIEANAIATTPGTAPTVTTPQLSGSGTPSVVPGSSGGSLAPAPSASSGGGGSFRPPTAPASTPFTPTPALPQDKLGQTATSPVRNAATTPQVAVPVKAVANSDSTRLLGLLVLVAGVGLALWAWRDEAKAKASPVEALVAEDGGLGRFVRPRTGAPPALT